MDLRPDLLFSDVPEPSEEGFIQETFINRRQELALARSLFKPDRLKDKIYAIHGPSRVGKSHLAIKLAMDMAQEHHLFYFYTSANMKGPAEWVLRTLYEKVRDQFLRVDFSKIEDEERRNHATFLMRYLGQINQVFMMPSAEIGLRQLNKEASKIKPDFRLKIPLLNLGIGLAGEKHDEEQIEQTIKLTRPDANGIHQILTFVLDMLAYATGRPF